MILIIYEVIILISIVLIVRLVNQVYILCNFNNLQIPDSYVKQNCCPIRMLGNENDIYLDISSITNVSSIRIYIGTNPTQFSISRKLTKSDMEYHTSIFMMKLILIGPKLHLSIRMNLYSFHLLYRSLFMVNLRPENYYHT